MPNYVMKPNVQGRYTMDQVVAGISLSRDGHFVDLNNGDVDLSPSDAALHLPYFLLVELEAAKDNLMHPFNPLLYTDRPITRLNYKDIAIAVQPHVHRMIKAHRRWEDAHGTWRVFDIAPNLELAVFDTPPEPIQKWATQSDPVIMATATQHHGSWVFKVKPE